MISVMTNPQRSTATDILLTSLIGDALALGPHWVYDQEEILNKLGRVTDYHAPISSYHPGKGAGNLTHYGDQTMVLLRSIAEGKGFSLERFATDWREFWEDAANVSYRDGATRETLEKLRRGASSAESGSDSHDIGGASRIAPLFLASWANDDGLILAARQQTAFTHAAPQVVESAEFFCRVVLAVRAGAEIPAALEAAMSGKSWQALPQQWLADARTSAAADETDSAVLKNFGLSCATENAFPGICHLLLRHPTDPAKALIENATAGGDCAARGMILGMVYGAAFPVSELPPKWLRRLQVADAVACEVVEIEG